MLSGGNTKDQRFVNAKQSLLPVDIKLIPSIGNVAGAKSVTIDEHSSGTVVAEGPKGFGSSYDIYLRPCLPELRSIVKVSMIESVPDQIRLSHPVLYGEDFNNAECKATVVVSAVDDSLGEGDHFVNVEHRVTNRNNNESILLTDGSPLLAVSCYVNHHGIHYNILACTHFLYFHRPMYSCTCSMMM